MHIYLLSNTFLNIFTVVVSLLKKNDNSSASTLLGIAWNHWICLPLFIPVFFLRIMRCLPWINVLGILSHVSPTVLLKYHLRFKKEKEQRRSRYRIKFFASGWFFFFSLVSYKGHISIIFYTSLTPGVSAVKVNNSNFK